MILKWFGHVKRVNEEWMTERVYESDVKDERFISRPYTTGSTRFQIKTMKKLTLTQRPMPLQ